MTTHPRAPWPLSHARRDTCPHCGNPLARVIGFDLREYVMCTGITCFYLSTAAQHDFAAGLRDIRDAMFGVLYVPQLVEWLDRQLRRFTDAGAPQ